MRMLYQEDAIFMATKVLIDLGILKILAETAEPIRAAELAADIGADPALVKRILKNIATDFFVHESGPETYTASDLTRCIVSPEAQGANEDAFGQARVVEAFPDFPRKTNHANPTNKDESGWKYAYKTNEHFFEYINSPGRERKLEALRNHMKFKTVGLKWYELPEIIEAVFGDAKDGKKSVLLIDVGGSSGHDLIGSHKAHPSMLGRLILQYLPQQSSPLTPLRWPSRASNPRAVTSSRLGPSTTPKRTTSRCACITGRTRNVFKSFHN